MADKKVRRFGDDKSAGGETSLLSRDTYEIALNTIHRKKFNGIRIYTIIGLNN